MGGIRGKHRDANLERDQMRLLVGYFLLFMLLLMTGCSPFDHPVIKPEEAVPYPELYGYYSMKIEDSNVELRIAPAGKEDPDGFGSFCTVVHNPDSG